MRRFLLLLSILCSVFISKVQAQEPRLTAPKNVCLNGYATMHAFLTSGTEDLVNWEITYPDGTVLDHRITWQDNYPDDHHPDFRYMSPGAGQSVTFEVRQVGTYTVTIRIRRDGNWSEERTKTFTSYDCTMDECEGTFTPATNFKETFGTFYSGAPRRQVEAPATITYNFLASGELADDQYSIYYSARLGGKAQWDNVFDHTDNGYGGMLIANSSNTPKLFYRRPVNNLCPGAKYNFSAWFINLNSLEVLNNVCQTEDYRYAGVTFIVRNASDNSIIKQFNTYDVSMDLSRNLSGDHRLTGWQQFGGTVTLAPGEENVIVEIMNNNPGGCGNDVAVDDIEFVFCAPKIYSYIDGLGVDNDMVCPGAELTITSKIEPADYFEDPVYVWEMNKNGAGWGPITEPGYTYPNGDSILHIGPGVLQELDYIQYRLYVFERNNVNTRGCYTPGNMVTISVPELPTIIASRPRICRGDTTTLTATPLEGPGITGYETFEFTGPNILTWPTMPAPKDKVMVTPVVTSTYEVTGSILYGQYGNGQPRVCQKEANITIEVDQPPTVNVGPDQRVCVNEPVTLDAGAANAVYPILWQPTNATTQTITVNAPGVSSTQAYRVTVTNGECKVSDTVNITAVAYPEATIVSQAAFCNTSPIPLVAVEPDPGYSGEWTIIGDDHGASIDDPTSYDNALLLNMPFDQPVTVRWTVTADGTDCSDYAEQDIIRESRPVSTPGPNQTSCTNVFTLAANAPANATMQGTWSVSGAGSVTFGDIHDPNTSATITSGVGIVTLAWTMAKLNSPSACGPDTKTMTIRYVDPPTLTINSTDISSCRGAGGFYRFEIPYTQTNAQVFDLEAVGPNPLPGFSNITNGAFVSPLRITYPASTPAGTYTFRMVARRTNLATCEVETFFSVRIETPSTLSSVSSNENTICIGNSATLTVTGTLGSNAQWVWYEGGCGSGTSIGSGASITVSPTSSTTYYVRAEGGAPCANTACGSVSVTVNQRPAFPDAGVDQENCNNPLFVLDAETPNVGTGRWTLPPGVTFVSGSILNPKSTVSVPVGQTVALGWTVTLGKCVVGPDTVILTNLAPIVNNVIEEDQLICSGDQPEEITAVGTPTGGNGSYTYQWQRSTTSATSGFMNIGSATGTNYQPPALTQTTWYRRVVTSGACTSNSNAVEITVSTAVPNIVSTPPDTSVQCHTGTDYTIYFGTPQFDHPEGLAINVTYADVVTPAACGQTITRTWTATDACNKTTTTSQTITVIDTIKPRPIGPTPADTTVSCDAVPDPATFAVSDNCSAAADVDTVFTETRISSPCANNYELVREWTLTDECGNDTIIRQRIHVTDTTKPRIVGRAPADTTVSCNAIPLPATFQLSDNCSVEANIDTTFTETRIAGSCANTYQLIREWVLSDECNNDTTIRQVINVVDTQKPYVVGRAPADTTVACHAVPDPATFLVEDSCSGSNVDTTFTETRINGTCANTYQLIREWVLSDECNNDTTIRQVINVIDTQKPYVVGRAPADTTVACNAVPDPATFLVEDSCSGSNVDTTFTETRINGTCANTYQLIREWVLSDECNNDTTIRQVINVVDTQKPYVVGRAPADTTVACNAVPDPATFLVEDSCSGSNVDTTFTETRIAGSCANTYQLIREWVLSDECNNDTTIRQVINVVDTQKPYVVGRAPADTTVACHAVPDPATFLVEDSCSGSNVDTTFTETRIAGSCANTYQLIRQWVLSDECNNDTTIRQVINVVDTQKPYVVGRAPADTTVACHAVPDPATFLVEDSCSGSNVDTTFTETRINGTCANTYQLIREWVLSDECNNDTTIRQVINVVDTQKPYVVGRAPADTTVACNAVPDPATFLVEDSCSGSNVDTTFTETRIAGSCANTYQLIREWVLSDECNNDTTIRQVINVVDTQKPYVVGRAPADTTVACNAVPDPATFLVEDSCSGSNVDTTFTETRIAGSCANTYQLIREWVLSDECNNDTTIRQVINVVDTQKPYVVGRAPADTTVACHAVPDPATFLVEDSCSGSNVDTTFTETRIAGSCANTYQLIREWVLSDECNNDTTIRQVINVVDTQKPYIVGRAPADTTVACHAVPDPATFLVEDSCSGSNVDTTFTETRIAGSCANTYQLIREWVLSDECNNDTTIRQVINVVDTQKPYVVGRAPADTTVACHAVPDPATFLVEDSCSGSNVDTTFTETRINGTCANTYQLIREWVLSDECNNDTTIRQVINVVDTQKPYVVGRAPADTTVACHAVPDPATFLVEDSCSGSNVDTTFTETRINGTCANTYQLIREWVLSDECNNDTTIRQVINVVDTQKPYVVGRAPADTTVACNAVPDPATFLVEDSCSGSNVDTTFTETRISGTCANTYQLIREWVLSDECNNDTTIRQVINVVDTQKPYVVGRAPADTTVACNAVPDPATFLVADSCSGSNVDTTFTETRINGTCANTYQLIREWVLSDECNNDTTIRQVINVVDTQKPYVVGRAPADTTVACHAVPDPATFLVEDSCSGSNVDTTFTETRINGTCANTYQLIREWVLSDECDNDTTIRQVINVVDTQKPYVVGRAPADTTVACHAVPDPATFLVADSCSGSNVDTTFTETRINGTCTNTYQLIREWVLSDECNNDTTIRQVINVIDTQKPYVVGSAPADTTVACNAVPDPATFLVADSCSGSNVDTTFTETRINGTCANTYQLIREWVLSDECNNDTTIRQVINVVDTQKPGIDGRAPADTTVSCSAIPLPATFRLTDNCSAEANIDSIFTETRIDGNCANTYQLIREWRLIDECNNDTIIRQVINVVDNTRPGIMGTAPADTTVSCDAVPAPATFRLTDNCSAEANIDTVFTETRVGGSCTNTYQLIREWRIIDECENDTIIRQVINVVDTTLPEFVLPLPANMTVECDNIPDQPDLEATDNCTDEVLVVKNETRQPLPGRCVNNYLIIRTWTAIDDCNNTITHTQTLTVIDTTAPVFDMIPPANITVACDSVPAQAEIDATDNCSADNRVTVTPSQVRVDGACANSYQLIRTWTARDECGNTRVITQTVNVEDRRAPVFTTHPRDTVVSCDAVPAQPELTATDNCSAPARITITPTETRVNGTCANSYRLIRTWTAVDECGNTTQWTQNVTVEDRTKPVFFTPTPADTTVDCNAIPAPPVMRAKDNCTDTLNVNIAYTEEHIDITGACANNYRLLRRWTATDECNNATTVIQVIDVRDTTKPQFVSAAPADTTVNCDAIPAQPDIDATDNCSVTANIAVVAAERRESIPDACVNNYRLIRTWTATDECNNTTVMTQVITVQDATKPVFTMATPANVTVECNAIPTQPMLTAADNCSAGTGVTVTRAERMEQIPGAICTSNYRLIRTWTATDQCGNSSTVTQTITVVDNTAPTFTMSTPADVTVECNAIPAQPDLTATDNCTPSNSISIVKNERRENIPGACVNNYRLIRTWTATDLCGNETTVQQVITVRDITAPTFTQSVPADATVECSAIPVMPDLQVTDNCTPSNRVTVVKTERREDIPGACVNNYRLIRTWTATDECSNTRTVQQVLTVVDRTPPAFTVATPANAIVECSAIPAQPDLAARDNCTTSPISIVKAERRENIPGACMNNYRLIRTWTATDECGNSAVVTQVLTVVDRTAPTFSMPVPADVTVECDAIPTQPDLTATDNCSALNSINIVKNEIRENIPGECINSYRLIRTWTATDECGNSATVRQVVTVQDRTAPVFTILPPANITVNCHEVPAAPVLTATDNCSGNNVTVAYSFRKQILSATCINNYRLTRTWTATDECGNQAVATQIVTVIDTTGPIFNAPVPQDMTVSCEAIPAPVIVTASDNCSRPGAVRVTHRQVKESIPGECTGNYRLINIWTARDECGNTSELRQVITVVDTTSPVIAMPPADITVPCGSPVPTADVRLMASDNCDPSFPKLVSYTTDPFVRDICNGYTIVRRWSVTDACGNAAQEVTQRIIVLPCPKPELAADVIVNCSSNPFITLKTNGRVTRPVYTLVGVTPANAVRVPVTSSNPRFNVNGATSASFIVRDGATGCASDTMTYDITYLQMPVVNLGNDTSLCGGNGMVLDAGAANFGYQIRWSTGETTQRIRVTQAGTYRVTVSNGMCTATDEITVGVIPMPLVNLPDTTICRGQNVILDASVPGASYLWSTGATTPSINVSTQEQFWVRVAKNGCITIDTINVTVNPPPDISLSRDTSICPGQSVLLTVSTDAGRIQWGTGEIGNSILVSKAGNYSVAVYRDNCVVREMVRVAERPDMELDLGPDRIICPGGSILVDARHPDASTYRWNDGDLNPVKSFSQGGKYILGVLDRYCDRYKEDSFNVIVAGPPTVNLGNDTVICKGRRFMLKANAVNATSYLWSNGQTSSSIEITEPGTYSVTAFNDCGSTTDEITIDVKECDSRPDFPNAFSPNGDGNNDVFRPVVRGPMYDYELRIFNRWGELVFLSKDMNEGWNGWYKGRPVDIGTFVWWMTYKKVVNGPSFIIKGDVTVIR